MKSILLVEDDDDIREVFKDTLEIEGYPVVTAANGREALSILNAQEKPGLILLDLMMPVMTGWEFLEARRGDVDLQSIPVVVVSAIADTEKTKGASGCLRKPVDLSVLLDTVKQYCS